MGENRQEKDESNGKAITRLDEEWRLMNAALERLGHVEAASPRAGLSLQTAAKAGRLIFGLDLTGSREPGLRQARMATAAMFEAIRSIGSIAVNLIFYRGTSEPCASGWKNDPAVLTSYMERLGCECGATQIAGVLRRVLGETEKVSGVVFVGDHCEENRGELLALAAALGRKSIPLFLFHECADVNNYSLAAKPVFKGMAEASGGVYVEFKPDSGAVLREMLSSVAAFSTAGIEGVKQVALPTTREARRLHGSLLLLTDGTPRAR